MLGATCPSRARHGSSSVPRAARFTCRRYCFRHCWCSCRRRCRASCCSAAVGGGRCRLDVVAHALDRAGVVGRRGHRHVGVQIVGRDIGDRRVLVAGGDREGRAGDERRPNDEITHVEVLRAQIAAFLSLRTGAGSSLVCRIPGAPKVWIALAAKFKFKKPHRNDSAYRCEPSSGSAEFPIATPAQKESRRSPGGFLRSKLWPLLVAVAGRACWWSRCWCVVVVFDDDALPPAMFGIHGHVGVHAHVVLAS